MLKVSNDGGVNYTDGKFYAGKIKIGASIIDGAFFVKSSTFYFTGIAPFSADQVNYELWVGKCLS
ncbi:hypothetical protein [Vibrio crassostreae]|uniref:hypothetical protein n=1 Tax=Vibrio crassostreae TaxID=246167 RepID=UPI001B312695|nr:hypothetical protein [Vibrio crassostreae]